MQVQFLAFLFKDLSMINEIPVLLISFNRPEMTMEAISNIKAFHPTKIYFSVDGPREDVIDDHSSVQKCRELSKKIDWECEVIEIFSEVNYGAGVWPYRSINEVLLKEKYLLIIEDDVRISSDFYEILKELLPRYESDTQIFSICASNISTETKNLESELYFFTKYFACWGWATWANKWNHYEYTISKLNGLTFWNLLKENNFNILITLYFMINFYLIKTNKLQTWDYQVNYLIFKRKFLNIKMAKNLSLNVGVGEKATHTKYLPKLEIASLNIKKHDYTAKKLPNKKHEKNWRKARIKFLFGSWAQRIIRK